MRKTLLHFFFFVPEKPNVIQRNDSCTVCVAVAQEVEKAVHKPKLEV